jgi:hypothetical protein
LYLPLAFFALGPNRPYPGDELRFIETSRGFAQGLTLDLLTHYPEMSGPLPFLYFGVWGRCFGWELATMRLGALAVGFVALLFLFVCLRDEWGRARTAGLVGAYLCLNPYVATLSVFVYTDMISVLFVLLAWWAWRRGWTVALFLAVAGAMLCRQYLIFLPLALLVQARLRAPRVSLATLAGLLPIGALLALWRGLAPDSPVRAWYVTQAPVFQTSAFLGYTGLLFLYLAPLAIWRWRWLLPPQPWLWCAPAGAAVLSLAFPVRPSVSSLRQGIPAVGLLDRALQAAVESGAARDLFYAVSAAAGTLLLIRLARQARSHFPSLAVVAFLLVMPWSYLYWEKYFLPVLPFAAAALLQPRPEAEIAALDPA